MSGNERRDWTTSSIAGAGRRALAAVPRARRRAGSRVRSGALSAPQAVRRHAESRRVAVCGARSTCRRSSRRDPIDGMLLTGPGGVRVRGRYGHGVAGRVDSARARSVADRARDRGRRALEENARSATWSPMGSVGRRMRRPQGQAVTSSCAHRDCRRRPPFDARVRPRPRAPAAAAAALGHRRVFRRRGRVSDARRDARAAGPLHRRRADAGGLTNACLVVPQRRGRCGAGAARAMRSIDTGKADPVLSRALRAARAVGAAVGPRPDGGRCPTPGEPGCCWPATRPASSIR